MGWLERLLRKNAVAPAKKGPAHGDWKQTLSQHFELTEVYGHGGYSTVYRGVRRADGRVYAVKVTDLDRLTDWSRQAAVREARVLAAMTGAATGAGGSGSSGRGSSGSGGVYRHPCIATYREAFCLQSRLCIVTDPATGGDLKRLLEQRTAAGSHLPEREVWSIFLQVALALKHLHAHRVLHRDLKPHNVLLGAGRVVQLTDFGICGQLSRVFTRKQAGTPQYKAPEMWNGQPYSFSSDIWSLGCLLYEMCAGRPLFDAAPGSSSPEQAVESVRQQVLALQRPPPLPSQYSRELGDLLALLLQQLPADRPSADELLALPSLVARVQDLPASVQHGLAGAAAAQQRWQQQHAQQYAQAVPQAAGGARSGGGGEPEPELTSFSPPSVNACLPPAAYAGGSRGLLGTPRKSQLQQQGQQGQQQHHQAEERGRQGRGRGRPADGGSRERSRSASAASDRSAASSLAGGSVGADSLSCLDLAVPSGSSQLSGSISGASSRSPSLALRAGDSRSSLAAMLARQSCPHFFATAASTSVQI